MNLHLFTDSSGHYIDLFIDRLEQMSQGENRFVNFYRAKNLKNEKLVTSLDQSIAALDQLLEELVHLDKVFFHPLNDFHHNFIVQLKKKFPKTQLYWMVWSKEVHVNFFNEMKLYDAFSLSFMRKKYGRKGAFDSLLKQTVKELYYQIFPNQLPFNTFLKSARKIDFICCLFEEEYKEVLKITKSRAKHLTFTYNDLTTSNIDLNHSMKDKSKVLVNHCADPLMNHYSILSKLSEQQLKEEVVVPLNYGDANYRKQLIKRSSDLNLNFRFIEEQLDYETYKSELSKVKCAFFNVEVQKALGNIFLLILMGVRVYLVENSPIYIGLKKAGVKVFSIPNEGETINVEELSAEEVRVNREMLNKLIGNEAVQSYYHQIFQDKG